MSLANASIHLLLRAVTAAHGLEPPGPDVRWTAPPACPDRARVAREIGALTADEDAANVRADGDVVAVPGGFRLQLVVTASGRTQRRQLESSRCETLAGATALIVALAIDPVASARAATSTPGSPQAPVTPRPPPRTRSAGGAAADRIEPPPEPRKRPRPRHRFAATAAAGVTMGIVPGAAARVEGDLGWMIGRLRLEALGFFVTPRTEELDPLAGVRVAAAGGGLRVCYALAVGPVEFPLCAGGELMSLLARGVGDNVSSQQAADLGVHATAGAGIVWPIVPRFALRARADALVALRRPGVHLSSGSAPQEVFRIPAIGFAALVGAQLRLP